LYSALNQVHKNSEHPDLVPEVRALLKEIGKPYVIENVEGAPLENYITLCGTMFEELRVIRHRLFECNFPIEAPWPYCRPPHPLTYTTDKRKPHYGKLDPWKDYVQVYGGGNCPVKAARDAMGIDWMLQRELSQAIPPVYTEYIGKYLKEAI
jgi:DNA (cytosine-5)-methyltransferase 1